MKRRAAQTVFLALIVLTGTLLPAAVQAANNQTELADLQQVMARAIEKVSPSVVRIIVLDMTEAQQRAAEKALQQPEAREGEPAPADADKSKEPPERQQQDDAAPEPKDQAAKPDKVKDKVEAKERKRVRSGLIISPEGYVITSLVNVGDQKVGLQVELPDGRVLPARRLGHDSQRDVLLLKVEAHGLPAPEVRAKSDLAVGQWVIALGKTLPIDRPTATKGILSALGRLSGVAIQTDAKISPINYGGPLVDLHGRVVAMVAAVNARGSSAQANQWSDSGIGFAIAMEDILARLPLLKEGRHIEPPFLGIRFNMVRLESGAKVMEVIAGTGAAESGMEDGDVIVEFQGAAIDTPFQLLYEIGSRSVGDEVTFKVLRDGKTLTLKAKLGARPDRYR